MWLEWSELGEGMEGGVRMATEGRISEDFVNTCENVGCGSK